MKVSANGQVVIPKTIRDRLGIHANTEIDFNADHGRFYIVKIETDLGNRRFSRLRGVATSGLSSDEGMRLTRHP